MTYYKNFRESLSLQNQDSFDYPINLKAIQTKKENGEIQNQTINPLQSYFLKGLPGRGKTAIAIHIAKNWLQKFKDYQNQQFQDYCDGKRGYTYKFQDEMYLAKVNFTPMDELIETINQAFGIKQNTDAKAIYQRWCEIPLLIVDDLGKEKLSDFRIEKVYNLLNHRYENKLQTVITTNFNLSDLAELGYSTALIDRIFGICSSQNVLEIHSSVSYRKAHEPIETNFNYC
ncbi:MAG: ATP-binding protein [Patescibacteria group bacterium]